jgi:hypothetical protein
MLDRPSQVDARRDLEPVVDLEKYESAEENKLRDPDGWRLKLLVKTIGLEGMDAGEKERLECTYERDRRALIKLRQKAEARVQQADARFELQASRTDNVDRRRRYDRNNSHKEITAQQARVVMLAQENAALTRQVDEQGKKIADLEERLSEWDATLTEIFRSPRGRELLPPGFGN